MSLYVERGGTNPGAHPTLVLMHFLGGSTREWDEVVQLLGPQYPTLRLDLPGFGGSHAEPGYTVTEMADAVAEATATLPAYVLVGHSMSGKVAAVLARRAEDAPDPRLKALILIAPSPPEPEPMGDEKRSMMLGLLGTHSADDLTRARSYITKIETRDIPPAIVERASAEVLRMNRTAWVAWLQHGSQEDWAARVGVLQLPALVVAGEKDSSLGPTQQGQTTLHHLGNARLISIPGCSHLIPMERPQELAAILRDFLTTLPRHPAPVPPGYTHFIASDRLSEPTRAVLEARIAGPAPTTGILDARQQRTLHLVCARVVPGTDIDLAATILARLSTGKGDGWRYDLLPPDAEAYRRGLTKLAEDGFNEADEAKQDKLLTALAAREGTPGARWFEELRGDATAAWVAHPATSARLGFSGPGVGGAHTPHRGFVSLGLNSREPWEPTPEP